MKISMNRINISDLQPHDGQELSKHKVGCITFVNQHFDRKIYFRIHTDQICQYITAYFVPNNRNLDGETLGNCTGYGNITELASYGATTPVVGIDTLHIENENQNIYEMYLDALKQIEELVKYDK